MFCGLVWFGLGFGLICFGFWIWFVVLGFGGFILSLLGWCFIRLLMVELLHYVVGWLCFCVGFVLSLWFWLCCCVLFVVVVVLFVWFGCCGLVLLYWF